VDFEFDPKPQPATRADVEMTPTHQIPVSKANACDFADVIDIPRAEEYNEAEAITKESSLAPAASADVDMMPPPGPAPAPNKKKTKRSKRASRRSRQIAKRLRGPDST
jgi:hypothetical protein